MADNRKFTEKPVESTEEETVVVKAKEKCICSPVSRNPNCDIHG